MEINALLCDHAESAEGKLFINGGGVNMIYVQPQPPYVISIFVAVVVHVPYTDTNVDHTVAVRLMDEDSNPVSPWAPEGVPAAASGRDRDHLQRRPARRLAGRGDPDVAARVRTAGASALTPRHLRVRDRGRRGSPDPAHRAGAGRSAPGTARRFDRSGRTRVDPRNLLAPAPRSDRVAEGEPDFLATAGERPAP